MGFPPQGAGGVGTGVASVDVVDRASRLLGIIYGSQGRQILQRATTFELLIQLRNAGIDIDPRQIRFLNSVTDSVDVSGSSVFVSGTLSADVTDRASRLLGIIYGSQGQQVLQRAATFELLVQLRNAGVDIDPRDRNWDLDFATDQVDISGSTVNVVSAPTSPILDFDHAQNVDRMESNTHIYTATGNFKLSSIEVSAPGSVKIDVQAGDSGSETTKMVAFTSPSGPTAQLDFNEELQLITGQRILVIRTNRENMPMDIYSTILGFNI